MARPVGDLSAPGPRINRATGAGAKGKGGDLIGPDGLDGDAQDAIKAD